MGFMEAVFSPVSDLSFVHMNEVRVKIAALKYGKKLLAFGWRPVVRLDLQSISTVDGLKAEIEMELERAGLKKADLEILMASTNSPRDLLYRGVRMLNEDFEETFGVRRKTIVLVDEYDKLFRDRDIDNYQQDTENDSSIVLEKKRTVEALFQIFGVGNQDSLDGISLLVLCGLARMVGQQALSEMNNIVDISQVTKYHGLCGISARELVKCANGRLDDLAKNNYNGKSFVTILKETFIPDWDGFRFGLDAKVGPLDPESFDGALFSPLDVWEIVRSLVENSNTPSSRWISTMKSEFEFTSFAERYTSSPERFFELCRNLQGGWVDTKDPGYNMNREDYLLLKENEHVRKVLFEVGLLSVKEISNQKALNQNLVRLGSPNWTVTRNAMRLLMDKTQHGITSEDLARTYVEDTVHGFGKVVASAAREVSTVCRGTGKDVLREYPFQDYLFAELLFRFPEGLNGFPPCYKLYKEKYEPMEKLRMKGLGRRRPDMVLGLYYAGFKTVMIVEVRIEKIEDEDDEKIDAAHIRNISKARKQVALCSWQGAKEETIQRVVVSGVWHPSPMEAETYLPYKLSSRYEFLQQITVV